MAPTKDIEKIAAHLYCLSILEEEVGKTYQSYADRVQKLTLKPLLLYIAQDSLKHAKILHSLSSCLSKAPISMDECPKIVGKAWENVVSFAKNESKKQAKLTDEELYSQINEMISLENTMGEEYLATLHLKLLQLQIDESQLDSAIAKKLLEYIVEDESRHKELLDKIAEATLKKDTKNSNC
ncbi:MAG: ferritin family protein [Candidatus Bathyarchaeia archaeon]|jgi:rubrerythrin